MSLLNKLDQHLLDFSPHPELTGFKRFIIEFLYFGIKEARACLFAGLFFFAIFITPIAGLFGITRYDILFIIALLIQAWMITTKLETWDELKAITLFHIVGFCLEVFKVSSGIGSWAYPDAGYTKIAGVPLFSGFMYAAVGSYIIQAWRLFDLKVFHHPPYWLSILVALLIYLNFFTHHYIADYRWYLTMFIMGIYARTFVVFTPLDRPRQMPMLLAFVLIGFFLWLAENIGTLFGVWRYPNQVGAWAAVHIGKWSSWSLLVIMTVVIVTNLKHIKASIYIPK